MCESVSNGPNLPRVVVVSVCLAHGCVSPSRMDQICHELLFVSVCLAHGCVSPSRMDQICHELLLVFGCFLYSWMCESVLNGPNLP